MCICVVPSADKYCQHDHFICFYMNLKTVLLKTESLTTHRMLAEGHLSTKVLLIFRISNQIKSNQIKSNQIKSLLLSHHHSTSALVSEILMNVLQTVQKTTIYKWTVHIYRLYRRQCAKYTYIYSVHIVYYKDILNYQLHIIHRMGASTLCRLSIHYVVYT